MNTRLVRFVSGASQSGHGARYAVIFRGHGTTSGRRSKHNKRHRATMAQSAVTSQQLPGTLTRHATRQRGLGVQNTEPTATSEPRASMLNEQDERAEPTRQAFASYSYYDTSGGVGGKRTSHNAELLSVEKKWKGQFYLPLQPSP